MTILDTLASHARARTLKNKHKISEEEIRRAALALGADTG